MGSCKAIYNLCLLYLFVSNVYRSFASELGASRTALLQVNGSDASGQPISDHFFGLFFEVH